MPDVSAWSFWILLLKRRMTGQAHTMTEEVPRQT
jgi:hypothetical protein